MPARKVYTNKEELMIEDGRNYTPNHVRKILAPYLQEIQKKNTVIRNKDAVIKKLRERSKNQVKLRKKAESKLWYRISYERNRNKKEILLRKKRIKEGWDRLKAWQSKKKRELYKELCVRKPEYKYLKVRDIVRPDNLTQAQWARLYIRMEQVRRKVHMTKYDVTLILWLYGYKGQYVSALDFNRDLGLNKRHIWAYSKRLRNFGLVAIQKEGHKSRFFLTDKGLQFAEPIVKYVKREIKGEKQKFKRVRVRNNVPVSGETKL